MNTNDTIQFFDYDTVLQDIEQRIASCNDLKTLLDLYARQSVILKLMLEQCELDSQSFFRNK